MRVLSLSLVLALSACNDKGDDEGGGDEGPVDSDGDGLLDDEEAELGLDPQSADSDGDGWDDLAERDAGTDGLACTSVPEGWPDCRAQAPSLDGTGWGEDEVMPNWSSWDQFGETVELYQFYGMVVVIDFSAGWCGPCNSAAPGMEDIYQEYKDQGLMMLTVMIDDNSNNGTISSDDFNADWADEHELSFPVLLDDSVEYSSGGSTYYFAEVYYELAVQGYVAGIPSFVVLDREMNAVDLWDGENESKLISLIEDSL
jgi:thiol-disulfide isomerase/thioredoxin